MEQHCTVPTCKLYMVCILAKFSLHHFIGFHRFTKAVGQDLRHGLLSHVANAEVWKAANDAV